MYVPVSDRKNKQRPPAKAQVQTLLSPKQSQISEPEPQKTSNTRSTTGSYVPVSKRTGRVSKTQPLRDKLGLKPFGSIGLQSLKQGRPRPRLPSVDLTKTAQSTERAPVEKRTGGKFVLPSVAKTVVQGTARGAAATGTFGASRLLGATKEEANIQEVVPKTKFEKVIFGKEPFSVKTEAIDPLITFGASEQSATKFGAPLLGLLTTLDAFTGGGKKELLKKTLVDTKTLSAGEEILKNLGISDDVVKDIAPLIIKSNDGDKIEKLIEEAISRTKETTETKPVIKTEVVDETFKKAVVERDPKAVDSAIKIFDNKKGNIVIDPDALKQTTGMLDPKDHKVFSQIAEDAYRKVLKEDKNDTVRFLAGGSGAGKSEVILKPLAADSSVKGIIVDGTLSDYSKALDKLVEAEKLGKAVEINAVLPDIERAWRWAQSRALRTGREVPLDVFIEKHVGFANSIKKLAGDGFKINLTDTRQVRNKADLSTGRVKTVTEPSDIIAIIDKLGYNADNLKKQLKNVKLSEKQIRKSKARREEYLRQPVSTEAVPPKKPKSEPVKDIRIPKGDGRDTRRSRVKKETPEEARQTRSTKRKTEAEAQSKLTDEEVAEKVKKTRKTKKDKPKARDELDKKKLEIEFKKNVVDNNPAKQLAKFAPKSGQHKGTLPEVTGIGTSKFARSGDDIVTELGFKNSEEAREAFDQYQKDRAHLSEMIEEVRSHTKDFQDQQKVLTALKREIKQEGADRQKQIQMVRDFFVFSDKEWNKILKRSRFQDPRLMSDVQFEKFMDKLRGEGEASFRAIERRLELKTLIYEKDFKKSENLFKAMGLPKMENMTRKQISSLIETMESFKHGDEFLGVRQIQTVQSTDIKDVRTIREALDALAKDADVPKEALEGISYKEWDKYRYDAALAAQNPLYDVMVTETNKAFLEAGENTLMVRNRLDELISAARKSRKRGLLARAVPTDKRIFDWLETDALGRTKMAEEMTAAELEAGHYIQTLYEQARDYLVQMQVLKKYRSDYITHVRRGFLESWKDDGLLRAIKESFEQYKQDEQIFNILDGKTGNILPLEKFFQFSMKRTGGLKPTQNVAQAVETYFRTFHRKVALDSLVPKIDIYAHSLSPRMTTERGVEMDETLKTFVKKWVNSKKGRVADTEIAKPGGRVDWGLRSVLGLTRMIDLGFSVPTGLAAFGGEQAATFTMLGLKKHGLGSSRMLTKRGQEILRRNEAFIGESTFRKIKEQSAGIGDKFMTGMFALFSESARTANAQFLLGNLTKKEWATGNISPDRLAQFKKEIGRYRVVEGAESVIGKTSPGKIGTQYKTWAIPIISTTKRNLETILKIAKKDGFKAVMSRRETAELFRSSILATTIALSMGGYAKSLQDKKDKTFADELIVKAYRDSLTLVGALDPTLMASEPRALSFIVDLVQGLTDIVSFEEGLLDPKLDILTRGRDEGEIRGLAKIRRTLSPKVVTQFLPEKKKKKKTTTDDPFADPFSDSVGDSFEEIDFGEFPEDTFTDL